MTLADVHSHAAARRGVRERTLTVRWRMHCRAGQPASRLAVPLVAEGSRGLDLEHRRLGLRVLLATHDETLDPVVAVAVDVLIGSGAAGDLVGAGLPELVQAGDGVGGLTRV